jgi:hypothetical protein
MIIPFIEKDCTIEHEDKQFSSGGAIVTDTRLIAYPSENGILNDWHGNKIGTYTVTSSRPAIFFGHHSHWGSRYYYMRATVNGKQYSLRGFGVGMVAMGKAIK